MEWKPVLNVDPRHIGPLTDGFDYNATYEFRRGFDGEVRTFRMADQQPAFNIAGLWFRPIA